MLNKGILVFLVGAIILASLSVFTIDQREKGIVLQFGRIVRDDVGPGLHFKLPFVQQVLRFDARIQNLDSEPQTYLTSEKKNVIVDAFVKWKIADVRTFYTRTRGSVLRANDRLGEVIIKRLRDEFGKRTLQQVVSGERAEIMDKLRVAAKDQADELGLTLVDVRIKRVELPEKVSSSVYDRMAAERKKEAKQYRSEGEEQAREIRAQADREREVTLAQAESKGQKIRGDGDEKATSIYANAFSQDPEFYRLYRSLGAYRSAFHDSSDILLIAPDSDFFKYFKAPGKGE